MQSQFRHNQTRSNTRRSVLVAALAGVLIICAVWGLRQETRPSTTQVPTPTEPAASRRTADELAGRVEPLPAFNPAGGGGIVLVRRNMFQYAERKVEATSIKPPAIILTEIQPAAAIAGILGSLQITVTGRQFPDDPTIIFDGVPVATRRTAETVLVAEIRPDQYSSPRTASVQVRSSTRPGELFSNELAFNVQPSPDPPFRFVGLIGDLGVFERIAPAEGAFRARRGQVIDGIWRIETTGRDGVDVTDLRYGMTKHLKP